MLSAHFLSVATPHPSPLHQTSTLVVRMPRNALLSAAYNTTAPAPGPLPPTWARCVDLGLVFE